MQHHYIFALQIDKVLYALIILIVVKFEHLYLEFVVILFLIKDNHEFFLKPLLIIIFKINVD